jgi:hypothetical protein
MGSPWVGRRWRGVSPAVPGLAMAVTVVELKCGGNERGRTPGRCEGSGVLGHKGRGEERRQMVIEGEAATVWSSIMSYFGRGSAGWWEVMRGECSSHFGSGRGW